MFTFKHAIPALILGFAACAESYAQTVVVDASTFGIFEKSTSGGTSFVTHTTPDNLPRYDLGSPFSDEFTQIAIRHYFVYDLSQITGRITSAVLKIYSPSDARSPNESDHYKLSAVSTDIDRLIDGSTNPGENAAAFDDLNDGTVYGQTELHAADVLTDTVLNIDLLGALADLNARIGAQFALGGSIDPIIGQDDGNGGLAVPYYFSSAQGSANPAPQLILETEPVPLPATWVMFLAGTGLISLIRRKA